MRVKVIMLSFQVLELRTLSWKPASRGAGGYVKS